MTNAFFRARKKDDKYYKKDSLRSESDRSRDSSAMDRVRSSGSSAVGRDRSRDKSRQSSRDRSRRDASRTETRSEHSSRKSKSHKGKPCHIPKDLCLCVAVRFSLSDKHLIMVYSRGTPTMRRRKWRKTLTLCTLLKQGVGWLGSGHPITSQTTPTDEVSVISSLQNIVLAGVGA